MDLHDLYRDVIVDHNRSPRNFRKMPSASHKAEGFNPLCGDKLTLYVQVDDGKIADISFEGSGCAISVASASLMTDMLQGRSLEEAAGVFENVHRLLTANGGLPDPTILGKVAALSGVRAFPTRVKCASLCWHTLNAALHENQLPVTTE